MENGPLAALIAGLDRPTLRLDFDVRASWKPVFENCIEVFHFVAVLELLREGRRSPAHDGGRLNPHWEGPTHDFGRRIVERVIGQR